MGALLRVLGAVPAVGVAVVSIPPSGAGGTSGGGLGLDQRDLRVHDAFGDASANDDTAADPRFPGFERAPRAIWKAALEWGSGLHADGHGDPHQPGGLGSGGAAYDPSWQGLAPGPGGPGENVHAEISGGGGGVLAYCETSSGGGWRIRYYSSWTWDDGPGAPVQGAIDLQGVAAHEMGHALGLGHSDAVGATMAPALQGAGTGQRSIEEDDLAALQALYGPAPASKPRVTMVEVDPAAGTAVVAGTGFAPAGNEVWLTRAAPSPDGAPVVAAGLAATEGGTRIELALPPGAGPGDLLVRVPKSGGAALSNAWPVDPGASGSPFGPPAVQSVTPAAVPALAAEPVAVELAGKGFLGTSEVRVAGQPAAFEVLGDALLRVEMPLVPHLGAAEIVAANGFGEGAPASVQVVAPSAPALWLEDPILLSASGAALVLGGEPGDLCLLAASPDLVPSVLPGIVAADVGNGFQSLFLLGSWILPAEAWKALAVPVAGLPFGTLVHFQAAVLDLPGGLPPLATSGVATGTFYF